MLSAKRMPTICKRYAVCHTIVRKFTIGHLRGVIHTNNPQLQQLQHQKEQAQQQNAIVIESFAQNTALANQKYEALKQEYVVAQIVSYVLITITASSYLHAWLLSSISHWQIAQLILTTILCGSSQGNVMSQLSSTPGLL